MSYNIQKLKQAAQNATQGQWIVEDKDCPWNVTDAEGGQVALAQQRTSHRDNPKQTDRTANAEFIAQANPANVLDLIRQRDELLAALVALVADCDTGERGPDGKQRGVAMPRKEPIWAAHAAIARAKGGAV